jgi:hypothetical protein
VGADQNCSFDLIFIDSELTQINIFLPRITRIFANSLYHSCGFVTSCPQGKFVAVLVVLRKSYD